MADREPTLHICDDWISIRLSDRESVLATKTALSTGSDWSEIVPGLDSIAVQFDPALVSPDEAATKLRGQLTRSTDEAEPRSSPMTIPVCYEPEFSPDRDFVAEKVGIRAEDLPSWHIAQTHQVAMLGFMPGFAYLDSSEECPAIGRLANPRQSVPAGSIGIIGQQSCIYSFDSPGGWPIIGRTPLKLFDPAKDQAALLSAGQPVRFESISRQAFENWPQEAGE